MSLTRTLPLPDSAPLAMPDRYASEGADEAAPVVSAVDADADDRSATGESLVMAQPPVITTIAAASAVMPARLASGFRPDGSTPGRRRDAAGRKRLIGRVQERERGGIDGIQALLE